MDEKAKNPNADTSKDEIYIDKLVYQLYQLTYEDVLIIDPEPYFTREEYENEMNSDV